MRFVSVLSLIFVLNEVNSAKILGIFNMASPSHFFLGNAYLRGLAEAGHDVTMISPYEDLKPVKNGSYRNIVLTGMAENMQKMMASSSILSRSEMNPLAMIPFVVMASGSITEQTMGHPNFLKIANSDEKFDVVVIEQFLNDGLKVLAPMFGAHLISFNTVGVTTWANTVTANPAPPSYSPEPILGLSPRMSFLERVKNWSINLLHHIALHTLYYWNQQRLVWKYLPQAPSLRDVIYNSSIMFLNTHESYNHPAPTQANMINIGGFHVKETQKLPEDLQKFMDEASEGVVYFSLGSNVKSNSLPEYMRDGIVRALSKLKQKVLWKWEDDDLPGKTDNIRIQKWMPQQEILAHPNLKVFITHGGFLSTTETIYHGVPVIAIPIFADQKMNAKTAVSGGYGLQIPLKELSEETLTSALNEMLSNPKFSEMAKYRSRTMHDRQVKPMESAIYWTEYVIRHNGAMHLRSAALELEWYQLYSYDVYAFVIASLIVLKFAISLVIKAIKGFFKSKKVSQEKKTK